MIGKALREARALATQARYLGFDLTEQRVEGGGPTVIFLHGLYASAGVFRPLRVRVHERFEATMASFSYPPGPGIVELAEQLARLIRKEPRDAPIHLVGHSLGGLVQRYYVQEMERDARVVGTVSLASPFAGTRRAWLVPGQAGRDICVGSELVERIRRGSAAGEGVRHLSIVAADDVLIELPALPDFGESLELPAVGHNGILFDERVLRAVVRHIESCSPERS